MQTPNSVGELEGTLPGTFASSPTLAGSDHDSQTDEEKEEKERDTASSMQ